MTEKVNKPDNIRYMSPQVKVVNVKSRHVLCVSDSVGIWNDGSDTDGGEMNENGVW